MTKGRREVKPVEHKLAGLDHLRALAITLVLLFHYRLFGHPQWIEPAGEFGWTGVDLFFVLSGYLISSQLFVTIAKGRSLSMSEFYIKRTFRIIPAYAITVALYFLVPAFKEFDGLAPLWKFITFTQNLGLDPRTQRAFSHCWSLCVEEQFYLALPLLIIAMTVFKAGKKAFWLLPILFIAGFLIRFLIYQYRVEPIRDTDNFGMLWTSYIYYPTYTRLDGLLCGVTIAAISVFKPEFFKRITKHGNITLLTSIALLAGAYFVCSNRSGFAASEFGFPLVSVGYGVMVLAALSPNCVLYKYRSRFTSSIAILSYSIYLIHKGVFHLVQQWFGNMGLDKDSNLMILPCIIFTVLAALVMRYTIEKPFLRMRDKVLAKRRLRVMKEISVVLK